MGPEEKHAFISYVRENSAQEGACSAERPALLGWPVAGRPVETVFRTQRIRLVDSAIQRVRWLAANARLMVSESPDEPSALQRYSR